MSTAFLQAEQLYRLGTFRLKIGRNVANHPLNREIHQGSIARLVEKFKENDEPACQQFPSLSSFTQTRIGILRKPPQE